MDLQNVSSHNVLDRCWCYRTTLCLRLWTYSYKVLVLTYHAILCHTPKHHKLIIHMF